MILLDTGIVKDWLDTFKLLAQTLITPLSFSLSLRPKRTAGLRPSLRFRRYKKNEPGYFKKPNLCLVVFSPHYIYIHWIVEHLLWNLSPSMICVLEHPMASPRRDKSWKDKSWKETIFKIMAGKINVSTCSVHLVY